MTDRFAQNMVRKSFDFDYYYKHKSEDMGDNYRDHICKPKLRRNRSPIMDPN